jgi:DNA-directed RNA polymerase specialized sigma24 family protein
MRREVAQRAEAMLVRSFAFEPAVRARLRREGTDAARIDEIVHEVYARLLIAAEAGRVRARPLRSLVFTILADVLRTASPVRTASAAPPPGGCPPQGAPAGPHPRAGEPSPNTRSAFESFRQAVRARLSARIAEGDELRRLIALAARFPAPQRQVFTLRKVYGLRPGAIAQALALTDAEVERHLIAAALACARHLFDPDRPDSELSAGDPV